MKLAHVFGLVVSVHVAVFTVIFATPGCRSTGKQKPRPEDTDPAQAGVAAASVDTVAAAPVESMGYDDINAGAAPGEFGGVSPVTPVTPADPLVAASAAPAAGGVRFAPTRPSATAGALAPVAAPVAASATHTVAKGDSLWSIARKHGITVAELAAANKLAPSATLRLGQTLTVPAAPAADASTAAATDAGNTYTVVAGDTLGAIARRQGTTVAALRTANNLSGDNLRVGQKLVVPGNAAPLAAATPRAASSATATPRAGGGTYTVVSGDTLGAIARRAGVKVGDLALLNNITDPAKLRVGQTLKLPAGATTPSAARPAAASPAPAPSAPVEATIPIAPVESAPAAVAPVEPVTPIEPMAIPVIRIDE